MITTKKRITIIEIAESNECPCPICCSQDEKKDFNLYEDVLKDQFILLQKDDK